jgi:hypothetical protein
MLGYSRRNVLREMGLDYISFGIMGQVLGMILLCAAPPDPRSTPVLTAELLLVLSTGVLVGGCGIYVRYHHLNRGWSLLGLLSLPGALFLIVRSLRGTKRYGSGFSVLFAEPYRRDVWRMDVKVKLDESLGAGAIEPIMLQLPRGSNVGSAMKMLAGVIAGLHEGELPAKFSINGQPVDRRTELSDGDELLVYGAAEGIISPAQSSMPPA